MIQSLLNLLGLVTDNGLPINKGFAAAPGRRSSEEAVYDLRLWAWPYWLAPHMRCGHTGWRCACASSRRSPQSLSAVLSGSDSSRHCSCFWGCPPAVSCSPDRLVYKSELIQCRILMDISRVSREHPGSMVGVA